MKRIYFTLIALVATLVANAQVIKVYEYDDNGNLSKTPAFTSDKKVEVVFKEQEHEYVDLGLPSGTLWATCNVGANSPEEFGDYFAWGETEPKETYERSNYKWGKGSEDEFTKYCTDSSYGTIDNKTELDPEDDAATANWGNDWCMPSLGQIKELYNSNYTTTEWVTQNGVSGRKITSKKNGMTLFLPAAGCSYDGSIRNVSSNGDYWACALGTNSYTSYGLGFYSKSIYWTSYYRYSGHPVRPVRVKK